MLTNRRFSQKQLVDSMKTVYRLLEYELKNNTLSLEYLNKLTDKKFPNYDHRFQEQFVDKMRSEEDYIGKKNIYDHSALKAIDDYRYNNDKLILYRNFLLLLFFTQRLPLTDNKTVAITMDSTRFIMDNYKSHVELLSNIFTSATNTGSSTIEKIDKRLADTIRINFEEYAKNIHFSFKIALVTSTTDDAIEKTNTTQFLKSLSKLLTLRIEDVIKLFFEVYENKYRHIMLPRTLLRFIHTYASRDSSIMPADSRYKKLYISGIASSSFRPTISNKTKSPIDPSLDSEKIEITNDNNNEILRQINDIKDCISYGENYIVDKTKNDLLLESTNLKYDVAISIIPEELDLFSKDEAIKKYPNHPINQISFYAYYEKIIHCIEYKALMIVPISLISSNAFSEKKFSKDIVPLNMGMKTGRDPLTIKSTQYQEFLQYYQINKIIKQQNIKKIMLLPTNLFYHTSHQCVLIELTKEACHGIQFIDATIYEYFEEKHARLVRMNLNKLYLPYIYDYYGESVFVDLNGDITKRTSENSTLISTYVPYVNLVSSNMLLPWYHIKNNSKYIDTKLIKIDDFFDVIKIQKPNHGLLYAKSTLSTVDIKQYSKSDFSPYGITSNNDITKIIKVPSRDENHVFKKFDLVFNNDILIYAHYNNITDMTFAKIHPMEPEDKIYFGTHNLIVIRVKEHLDNQDAYAKALFLWLMSNEGQKSLQSITKTTSANRPLISTEDLKMLQVNLSGLDNAKASFKKMENEIVKIKKSIKSIQDLIG